MREKKDPKNLAWELFEESGNLSYYLLYKRLQDGEKNRRTRPPQ